MKFEPSVVLTFDPIEFNQLISAMIVVVESNEADPETHAFAIQFLTKVGVSPEQIEGEEDAQVCH